MRMEEKTDILRDIAYYCAYIQRAETLLRTGELKNDALMLPEKYYEDFEDSYYCMPTSKSYNEINNQIREAERVIFLFQQALKNPEYYINCELGKIISEYNYLKIVYEEILNDRIALKELDRKEEQYRYDDDLCR